MTDRTDHRAEARELLTQADGHTSQNWPAMTGEHKADVLAAATVHALLAIHDTLTAADRYAANEEQQREGQMEDAWQSRDWESVRRLQDEALRDLAQDITEDTPPDRVIETRPPANHRMEDQ